MAQCSVDCYSGPFAGQHMLTLTSYEQRPGGNGGGKTGYENADPVEAYAAAIISAEQWACGPGGVTDIEKPVRGTSNHAWLRCVRREVLGRAELGWRELRS